MDLETFVSLGNAILNDLEKVKSEWKAYVDPFVSTEFNATTIAKVFNFLKLADGLLPEHTVFIKEVTARIRSSHTNFVKISDLKSDIAYILELCAYQKRTLDRAAKRMFYSYDEKMKQAGVSFENGDFAGVMNNLNTALELMLKDKLNIPVTIARIKTSNIIDILVKYKIGPTPYLLEAQKHLHLDNKTKHVGYAPSKLDCVNAIKAVEDLAIRLKEQDMNLSEEVKNKIFQEL